VYILKKIIKEEEEEETSLYFSPLKIDLYGRKEKLN